jgi:hypothetical protein
MANALFDNYKNVLWGGGVHGAVDWDADSIKISAVDHGTDTPAPTTDQDIADIVAGARIFTTTAIASVTIGVVANGTVDHADKTQSAVSGASIESLVWWKDSGVESTSPLILFIDTATGLPVTPNGGDITITLNASGLLDI